MIRKRRFGEKSGPNTTEALVSVFDVVGLKVIALLSGFRLWY